MAKKPEDIGRIPSRVSKEAKERLDELASASGRTQTSIIEEGIKMVAKLRKPTAKAIVIATRVRPLCAFGANSPTPAL